MKRRISSAALTSSPAGWLSGLRGRDGEASASTKPAPSPPNPARATSVSDLITGLSNHAEQLQLELDRVQARLRGTQWETVATLVAAVEAKDPLGQRHSTHVALIAERLAAGLRRPPRESEIVRIAAILHDIGKIAIPDAILMKPGPLTADEYSVVKQHPVVGAAILRSATWLRREVPLVLHHHEWYGGGGYPHGLRGEQIPFGARLLHVADAVDAMLSPRSYKESYGVEQVCRELHNGRGTQFDPIVADVATTWLQDHFDELAIHDGERLDELAPLAANGPINP